MRRFVIAALVLAVTFIAGIVTGVYSSADPVYDALKSSRLSVWEIGSTGTQTSIRRADNSVTSVDLVDSDQLRQVVNGLHFLKSITLSTPSVDDNDLKAIAFDIETEDGPLLEGHIDLRSASVTDVGMSHLAFQIALTELSVADTQVTDAGLSKLHRLKDLRILNITKCDVTETGISTIIQNHPRLSRLYARELQITPAVIEALKSAQQLDWLDISDPLAPIDQDLIDQLKAAIPNCHIVADTGK